MPWRCFSATVETHACRRISLRNQSILAICRDVLALTHGVHGSHEPCTSTPSSGRLRLPRFAASTARRPVRIAWDPCPLIQRNTCACWRAVSLAGRPVARRAASARPPFPRPQAALSHREIEVQFIPSDFTTSDGFSPSPHSAQRQQPKFLLRRTIQFAAISFMSLPSTPCVQFLSLY